MRIKTVSALEKCFPDETVVSKPELNQASMLKNERYSFQIIYDETELIDDKKPIYLRVDSPIASALSFRRVEAIPSLFPVLKKRHDSDYLRTAPGLYPDLLVPLRENEKLYLVTDLLRSVWVDIEFTTPPDAGTYPIHYSFVDGADNLIAEGRFDIEVIDAELPAQDIAVTQWFYCDCLQVYYRTKAFDEEHWRIIENFMKTAVKNGINTILTPVFTPPLDTAVGSERPTTQLVGVTRNSGRYSFDFTLLNRWIDLCDKVGIQYLEISHFYTQWGAEHAPKVMATVDGEYKRLFGWETDALGEEYRTFLRTFIPELRAFLKTKNADNRCFYHISDEPNEKHLEQYKACREQISDLLEDCIIMDALSTYAFYEQGIVTHPIPSNNHIEPFLEHKVPDLWTYYCVSQAVNVSNRFFAMPSARNRIIGTQFYKYDIKGFLQWGYNFYFNQFSIAPINPFLCSDGEFFAPSGDTYSVYPAPDGTAWESLRIVVFAQALQDLRAMKLCEKLYGRAHVMALMEEGIEPITFQSYPRDAAWLLHFRERLNREIQKATKEK